jgi:diacylglycerol kinase (ATP)
VTVVPRPGSNVQPMTTEPSWVLWGLALALSLALLGAVIALVLTEADAVGRRFGRSTDAGTARPRAPRSAFGGSDEQPQPRVAIVVNPTKFDEVARVKESLTKVCYDRGWSAPLWLPTTLEDPGTGQTRQAVDEGVDLVCALGGDGTVRTVGAALAGTGVPMGLLPAGTGNLLARNLSLPIDSVTKALEVALSGRNARIDTCVLTLTRPTEEQVEARLRDEEDPSAAVDEADVVGHIDPQTGDRTSVTEKEVFLVMAGVGFDAEVMAGAPEELKARMGWAAYLVSAAQHLKGPEFVADIRLDDGTQVKRHVRGVIVGNVGKLQGGVTLLPEARSDDGVVDAVVIAPQGIVGWGAVATQLLTRQRKGHGRVEHFASPRVRLDLSKPIEVEVDGDTLGTAVQVDITVDRGSLVVRLPQV